MSRSTASLPAGWNERLIPICNPNTNGATGWCIETHDIAVAKYPAGRPKDLRYTRDLWENGLLDPQTLDERLRDTPLKPTDNPGTGSSPPSGANANEPSTTAVGTGDASRPSRSAGTRREGRRRTAQQHSPKHRINQRRTAPGPRSKHRRGPRSRRPSGIFSAAATAPLWIRWPTKSPPSDSMARHGYSRTHSTGNGPSAGG